MNGQKVVIQTEWKLETAFRFDDNIDDFANGGSGSYFWAAGKCFCIPSVSNSSTVPNPSFNGTVPQNWLVGDNVEGANFQPNLDMGTNCPTTGRDNYPSIL